MGERDRDWAKARATEAPPFHAANDADAPDPLVDFCALQASLRLHIRSPHLSAMKACGIKVSGPVAASISLPAIAGLFHPGLAALGLAALGFAVFTALVAWRIALLLVATTPGFARPITPRADAQLPIYTVFVPLFREAAAVPGLAEAMGKLNWPAAKLDLIILSETGDTDTIAAVEAAHWPAGTTHLTLPPGAPQTKPRALNYGLQHARGQMACIYDAEDRPHPNQLRAAHAAFLNGPETLACVQAPLAGYNHRQSWLAAQWTMEYAVQFGLLLPGLARLGLPILLGGTSNHFRTAILRRLHGWDAWNVTEDADLGVRLARKGYRSGVIALPTYEEAPETLGVWTAQRSRWLKGFWQSWIVAMRDPAALHREVGTRGALALHLMLAGTCLAALLHGPLMLVLVVMLALGVAVPPAGLYLLALGYGINAIAALVTPGPRGMQRWLCALTLPFYWPLHTLAAVRALYGWLRAPHFWAKTPHGLTAHPL